MQLESSNIDDIGEEQEEEKDEKIKLEKLWMKHRMQLENFNIDDIEEEQEEKKKMRRRQGLKSYG